MGINDLLGKHHRREAYPLNAWLQRWPQDYPNWRLWPGKDKNKWPPQYVGKPGRKGRAGE